MIYLVIQTKIDIQMYLTFQSKCLVCGSSIQIFEKTFLLVTEKNQYTNTHFTRFIEEVLMVAAALNLRICAREKK